MESALPHPPAWQWHRPSWPLTHFPGLHRARTVLSNLVCGTRGSRAQPAMHGNSAHHQAAVPGRPSGAELCPRCAGLLPRGTARAPCLWSCFQPPGSSPSGNASVPHLHGCSLRFPLREAVMWDGLIQSQLAIGSPLTNPPVTNQTPTVEGRKGCNAHYHWPDGIFFCHWLGLLPTTRVEL